jgi:outer membrane receptor protein involved in Fe transport
MSLIHSAVKRALLGVACSVLAMGAMTIHAEESAPVAFSIGAQNLASALTEFARQSQQQLLFAPELVSEKSTAGVQGKLDAFAALSQLLRDTGLTFSTTKNGAILIGKPTAMVVEQTGRVRLAQATSSPDDTVSGNSASAVGELNVEEIIVTAQKKQERLQDVPVPVSVIGARMLVNSSQNQLQDYYTRIPGLSLTPPGSYGGATIAIRGLVSGLYSNPTVGTVIDDVSYNSPSSSGFGNVVAEVDPSDLSHVEVLRGPQGTLYGASSIGGLLKYVTIDPSTDALEGSVQLGLSGVENADDAGYSVRGNVNIPLSDRWAIRVSGFKRREAGYIDDPDHGATGVNEQDVQGGRASALWRISDNVTLKLGALVQNGDSSGNNYVSAAADRGDLEQSVVPDSGGYDKKLRIYSANLSARIGGVELTSISAYADVDTTFLFDLSPGLGGIARDGIPMVGFNGFGVSGVSVIQPSKTTRFTQEVRAVVPLSDRVEWLVGVYYADEDTDGSQLAYAADFDTAAIVGELARFRTIASFEEYAAFTNLTFDVTDRFDVQVGGRFVRDQATYAQTASLAWVNGGAQGGGDVFDSEDSAFTYLVTPRFKLSSDLMMYARLASGYRPGGPNTSIGLGIPTEYGPDKTLNYEVGVKGKTFDGLLAFDASVYYIDWKDIQIALTSSAVGYNDNGSRAKSQGIELSLESRPTDGLTLSAWATYSDAELKEDLPSTASGAFARAGDRLPYSSRFSGSLSLDQDFPLGAWTGSLGASLSYVGDREEAFAVSAAVPREQMPSYTKTDLRAGLRDDSWSATLFVNNLSDKRGVIGVGSASPNTITYIQPRTYGVSLTRNF